MRQWYYKTLNGEDFMSISKETIEYVAHLARLELKAEELDTISGQLKEILGFIDTLSLLDITDIPATSHILPVHTVVRDDLPGASLTPDEALANAPQREKDFFGVPKVIE